MAQNDNSVASHNTLVIALCHKAMVMGLVEFKAALPKI